MDRVMCLSEFLVGADMLGRRDLAGGRLGADYFAFTLKGANDLDPEVNVHRFIAMGRVMVEEAIVPTFSQVLMAAEELPDEIKRRLPGAANVPNRHAPVHRGE